MVGAVGGGREVLRKTQPGVGVLHRCMAWETGSLIHTAELSRLSPMLLSPILCRIKSPVPHAGCEKNRHQMQKRLALMWGNVGESGS